MRKKIRKLQLTTETLRNLAGILALAPGGAGAQGRIQRVYTTADGLAHASVLAMAEDRDGFLWLGTADGISRFDGTEFTRFPAGNRGPSGVVFTVRPREYSFPQ